MDYITEIKAFYNLLSVKSLSTGQIALWHALMHINNIMAWQEWFSVGNSRIEFYSGLSRSGVLKARNELKQQGLIDFQLNGKRATSYKLNSLQIAYETSNSTQDGNQNSTHNGTQNSNCNGAQNSNTLKDKQNKDKTRQNKTAKKKFGEYGHVTLADEELEKLNAEYGEERTKRAIVFLDEYVEMKGYKHNSSYLAMKKWVFGALNNYGTKSNYAAGNAKNKFCNFEPPKRDFNEIERLSKERLKKEYEANQLGGG